MCLAYFESKFNPTAIYDNVHGDYMGFGLFQMRNNDWCDHGKNLCHMSCYGRSVPPGAARGVLPAFPTVLVDKFRDVGGGPADSWPTNNQSLRASHAIKSTPCVLCRPVQNVAQYILSPPSAVWEKSRGSLTLGITRGPRWWEDPLPSVTSL